MSGMTTPGVTPFDRSEFITDERFNLMVAELAAKIAAEGGGSELIGDLANLTTEAKANLVTAINELDSEIGDLSGLTTTAKNTIIGAINEVDSAIGQKANSVNAELSGTAILNGKNIATTQKNIPTLLNGWLTNGTVFCAKSGNIATLNLRIRSGSMTQFSSILNLPSGFEPTESVLIFAMSVGGAPIGQILINTNGSVTIFSLNSNSDVVINASWVTV